MQLIGLFVSLLRATTTDLLLLEKLSKIVTEYPALSRTVAV
jgi:hypothetical protein